MSFVAIDVETATPDITTLCQIGMVDYKDPISPLEFVSYVDPQCEFDPWNVSIHGIEEQNVAGAPNIPEILELLRPRLTGRVVVHHSHFDRTSINRACERFGLPDIECTWLDSARVVRRAWSQFERRGYGIANVAACLDLPFSDHHDALADARMAGTIMHCAMETSGLDLDGWLKRVRRPISPPHDAPKVDMPPNPDGTLYGEVIVFTGALSMPRVQAKEIAAQAGCTIAKRITKHTTLLVVGRQDIERLAGHKKSSKHRKAEEYIERGVPIRIIIEDDFRALTT